MGGRRPDMEEDDNEALDMQLRKTDERSLCSLVSEESLRTLNFSYEMVHRMPILEGFFATTDETT
jgi:hypothetical protein